MVCQILNITVFMQNDRAHCISPFDAMHIPPAAGLSCRRINAINGPPSSCGGRGLLIDFDYVRPKFDGIPAVNVYRNGCPVRRVMHAMYVAAADRQVRDIPSHPFCGFGGDDIQSARIVRTHPVAGFLNDPLEYTERTPRLVIVDRRDDSSGPDRGNDRKIVVGTQKDIVAPISIGGRAFCSTVRSSRSPRISGRYSAIIAGTSSTGFSATRRPTFRQNVFISMGRSAPFSNDWSAKQLKKSLQIPDGNCLQIFQRIWL